MQYKVGQHIELRTHLPSPVLGVGMVERIFRGQVVENPRWLGSDYVSVHTGDRNYPVSHIKRDFIVGENHDVQHVLHVRLFKVSSRTKNSSYLVEVSKDSISCDCLGFSYRRDCRHAQAVRNRLTQA